MYIQNRTPQTDIKISKNMDITFQNENLKTADFKTMKQGKTASYKLPQNRKTTHIKYMPSPLLFIRFGCWRPYNTRASVPLVKLLPSFVRRGTFHFGTGLRLFVHRVPSRAVGEQRFLGRILEVFHK